VSINVVVGDPASDASRIASGVEGIQDRFLFERPPQPLDEDVVHPATATVHGGCEHLSTVYKGRLVNSEPLRVQMVGIILFVFKSTLIACLANWDHLGQPAPAGFFQYLKR
jgi:hypothetical protein